MSSGNHFFNGIDALTGELAFPAMGEEELADALLARGADDRYQLKLDLEDASLLVRRHDPGEAIDPRDLSKTGWGVIYAENTPSEVIRALENMREHRLEKIGGYSKERLCREFYHRPGMSAANFLRGQGVSLAGTADVEDMPYYLLLVGSPEEIPFSFQYGLSQQYGVGRLYFEGEINGHDPARYRNYADNVIAAESYNASYPQQAVFWGAVNRKDQGSRATAYDLISAVAEKLEAYRSDWSILRHLGPEATKFHLTDVFHNDECPALLVASGHGLCFTDKGIEDERTIRALQGSLVCSRCADTHKLAFQEYVYTARDLTDAHINLSGMIAFFFANYSAGTPPNDDFTKRNDVYRGDMRRPFVAQLPQAMLGHKKGALAVIGHVGRTWTNAYHGAENATQMHTFSRTLMRLLDGKPVGNALGCFAKHHSHLALQLRALERVNVDLVKEGDSLPPYEKNRYARLWKNDRDARNLIVLGDPAVRINLEEW